MIIKKDSWHYKFNNFWDTDHKLMSITNLCNYVHSTIVNFMWTIIFSAVVTVIAYAFIANIAFVIKVLIGAACVAVFIFVPKLAIHLFRKVVPDSTIHTPSIMTEYIKAKKGKYCPQVTFK